MKVIPFQRAYFGGRSRSAKRLYINIKKYMLANDFGRATRSAEGLCRLHEGTMCWRLTDNNQTLEVWWEIAERGDLTDDECCALEASTDPADQAQLAAWLEHWDAAHAEVHQ